MNSIRGLIDQLNYNYLQTTLSVDEFETTTLGRAGEVALHVNVALFIVELTLNSIHEWL